jgi:hypothetical protein
MEDTPSPSLRLGLPGVWVAANTGWHAHFGQAGVVGADKCLTPEQAMPMEEAFADIVDTCIERVQQEATNPRIDQHALIVAEMALSDYLQQFSEMVSYFQDMPCLPCPFLVGNITKLTDSVTAQLTADYPSVGACIGVVCWLCCRALDRRGL